MSHIFIRSKMKKSKPLMNDPIISRYVPDTYWFHASRLQKMLQTNSSVYIKPDKGSRGVGIIRVKGLNNFQSEVSIGQRSKKCPKRKVHLELIKLLDTKKKKYIIQEGIDLATYDNRPFDVRVVLQKPLKKWRLTWISAKLAPRKTSVVTNVAQGAKDVKMIKMLKGADQPLNVSNVKRKLIDVSYKIAQKLGSHFPLNILGLDMGIDKKGKIWFIEANTNPDFRGLRKLDPKQYRRYLAAKKLSEKGYSKTPC